MTDKQILEGNKLIAEFMGAVLVPENGYYKEHYKFPFPKMDGTLRTLKYHSSWDWLMPVVEKIKKLEKDWPLATDDLLTLSIATPIEIVFEYIVIFIKWYNQNK